MGREVATEDRITLIIADAMYLPPHIAWIRLELPRSGSTYPWHYVDWSKYREGAIRVDVQCGMSIDPHVINPSTKRVFMSVDDPPEGDLICPRCLQGMRVAQLPGDPGLSYFIARDSDPSVRHRWLIVRSMDMIWYAIGTDASDDRLRYVDPRTLVGEAADRALPIRTGSEAALGDYEGYRAIPRRNHG